MSAVVLILLAVSCGCLGMACAVNSGRYGVGFMLGVLLGPIGWACALFLPRHRCQVLRVSVPRRRR